jgi:hypothetical protein
MNECTTCGAPVRPGFVVCPFCRRTYPDADASRAIPCPSTTCHELTAWGASHCVRCNTSLIAECVFCRGRSPHNQPACLACGEAFAGAAERKAAHEAQLQSQRTQQAVLTYAPVAMSFLGSFAGAAVSSGAVGDLLGSFFD